MSENLMEKELKKRLDEIEKAGLKFAIWGAGNEGRSSKSWIENYSQGRLAPEFIIDNNSTLWGKNGVVSPDEFFLRMGEIDTVVICVYVADQVEEQIRKGGYTGRTMVFLQSIIHSNYYKNFYEPYGSQLDHLNEMLVDERSRDTLAVFREVLNTGQISLWNGINADSGNKMMEPEILDLKGGNEHFVDVGAFTGDTIEIFLSCCNYRYESILGIEPDKGNYELLKKNLSSMDKATALQIAVSDKEGTMMLESGLSEGSRLAEVGTEQVDVRCLDNLEEARDATFIKASTLGGEVRAFMGAEEIIKRNKPQLAYYCSGTGMWEIPLFLRSLVPEYKFYVRHYGYGIQAMAGFAVVE